MDAERCANRVAVRAILNGVLSREHLDAFLESAAFDGNSETEGKIVDIDAALRCQQRLLPEDPEVAATAGLFESSFHAVLLQLPLQLEERFKRTLKICINRYPLGTLCVRVDGIQVDGQVAVKMHPDHSQVQGACLFDIRHAAVRKRLLFLYSIGQAVHKQLHELLGSLTAYTKVDGHVGILLS